MFIDIKFINYEEKNHLKQSFQNPLIPQYTVWKLVSN